MTVHPTAVPHRAAADSRRPESTTLVACSLEPWGEVRSRMHLLVDELVDLEPSLHVLYVDPPAPVGPGRRMGRGPRSEVRLQRVHPRMHVLRTRALPGATPRGPAGRWLDRQVLDAVGELGLRAPLLWINNPAFASLAESTGWPSLYELGNDWRHLALSSRERSRREEAEQLLLGQVGAVVVNSPELARARGLGRAVELIPNGVDAQMFRVPRTRPAVLPGPPVALHVGTLDTDRLDVPLILELSRSCPELQVVLAGPADLPGDAMSALEAADNVHLLGPRPYDQVPALLQHADVVIVPHLVNPYTESLDPINAYECRAVGRPTVATPVSGFRACGPPVVVSPRQRFVETVEQVLAAIDPAGTPWTSPDSVVPSWQDRAEAMVALMGRIAREGPS